MKKLLLLIPVFFLFFLTANATDYYIAANGNDNNNGTSQSSPWKSINKLNAYFSNMRAGDHVYFRRGDTFYGGIMLNKSGTAGAPITIGAYGSGAKPIITGFNEVTSWNNLGGNIWESSSAVSNLSKLNLVIIKGKNTPMGRWPNSGWITYQSANTNKSITSNSLGGSPNWKGAEAVIRKNYWSTDRGLITSQSGSTINYNSNDSHAGNGVANNGFFIQNDVRTLDSQNEWYYNPSTKKLRIFSTSMPTGVQVTSVENIITTQSYIVIDNLNIIGANSNSIYVGGAITVTNCEIAFSGINGINTIMGSRPVIFIIEGNSINQCNNSSINYTSSGNNPVKITNNLIRNNSMITGGGQCAYGSNIALVVESRNTGVDIGYNRIDSSGYIGILFKTGTAHHNYVTNFCSVMQDGGGIYTNAGDKNTIVEHNIVSSAHGDYTGMAKASTLVYGVYSDLNSSGATVRYNTVSDITGFAYYFNDPDNLTLTGNTSFGVSEAAFKVSTRTKAFTGANFQDNIFCVPDLSQSSGYFMAIRYPTNLTTMGLIDNNHLVMTNANKIARAELFSPYSNLFYNISTWNGTFRNDLNSLVKTIEIDSLRLETNPGNSAKTINLGANYLDPKGESYNGSITLAPYASAVLISNGSIKNQEPTADAGPDQTITLPTNKVSLNGKGSLVGGTISSYNWRKVSGPSTGIIADASAASTQVTELTEGVYSFQLTVTGNTGETGTANVQMTVTAQTTTQGNLLPAINPSNIIQGLNYDYYESSSYNSVPDFSKIKPVNAGNVSNFDLSVAQRDRTFSIDFNGYIDIPQDGMYNFFTSSDDGSLLFIDNQLVVNNDGQHGLIEKSGTVGLKAGKHAISVGFFQEGGGKALFVSYSGPGIPQQTIPSSMLYRTPSPDDLLPAVNPTNIENGLSYKYYEGSSYSAVPDFSIISPVKTGIVSSFDLSVAQRNRTFSIDFNGYINVPTDGIYTFYTSSDDGSLLYIDNQLVVNNDGQHGIIEKSGTIGLKAGKHAISVGFFQEGGNKSLSVSYEGSGIKKQLVPYSNLFREKETTGNGLTYNYYEASSYDFVPDFSKVSPIKTGTVLNFDISVAKRDNIFAIEFTGYINIEAAGQYTFYTTSDDGSLLYIDNKLIVSNDGRHGALERSGSVYLTTGSHSISVGFFQQTGNKILQVMYQGPGITKRLIPSSQLYTYGQFYAKDDGFGGGALSTILPLKDQNSNDLQTIKISAYPNPFINSINVTLLGEAGEFKLQMIDALGRTLWTKIGKKNEGYYQQMVNTSSLQKGVYFLKVIQNDKSSILKLLK